MSSWTTLGSATLSRFASILSYLSIFSIGLAKETLKTAYEPRRSQILLIAMMGAVVLVLTAGAGMRRSVIRAWQIHYVRKVREACRIATEHLREGFYMLRPPSGPAAKSRGGTEEGDRTRKTDPSLPA